MQSRHVLFYKLKGFDLNDVVRNRGVNQNVFCSVLKTNTKTYKPRFKILGLFISKDIFIWFS